MSREFKDKDFVEKLRKELCDKMWNEIKPNMEYAREIGISVAVLSKFVNGKSVSWQTVAKIDKYMQNKAKI